jgi:hypothetical protein
MDYSPLWLRLWFIPTGKAGVVWTGIGLNVAFLLSLGFLPRPRRGFEFAVSLLAVFSAATIFALERGNIDLPMVVLAILGALSLDLGVALHVAGYGPLVLAGMLKFCPSAGARSRSSWARYSGSSHAHCSGAWRGA